MELVERSIPPFLLFLSEHKVPKFRGRVSSLNSFFPTLNQTRRSLDSFGRTDGRTYVGEDSGPGVLILVNDVSGHVYCRYVVEQTSLCYPCVFT